MKPLFILHASALTLLANVQLARAESSEIEELKAMVKTMQKTIAEQSARIAALEKQQRFPKPPPALKPVAAQRSPGAVSAPAVSVASPPGTMPKARSAVRDADNFTDLQQAVPRTNNVPLDPDLKGFMEIPGTDTIFKLGGSARLDAIVDFENNGNPNLFIPSTIPVPGQPGWNGGERSSLQAKGTRLSFELRRPVPFDSSVRIYTEYDFFDTSTSNSMNFRVRHFYGQAWNLLIGQTYSAFMDADASPDVVDYQGPNGMVNRRQPQIRYTLPIYDRASKVQIFASLEQPSGQIFTNPDATRTGSTAVNHVPDGVAGVRWEGTAGHLQGAALFRELSLEADTGASASTFGWGASLSAALNVSEKDKLSAQVTYGEGVARYIADLSGGNLDAAFTRGGLEAIPVFAAMAGYTHQWDEHWRSTISGGYVRVDAPAWLGPLTIDNTIYGSANLMWHPSSSFRMGVEYLYGRKETLDRSERDAHRLNFVVRYDLVR
jgi:hypothetical protein